MRRLIIPLLIILAGAAIQFHALVQDVRFYPDEALFSTFARNAALNGDWLLHGSLDKTPLSIYASALSMHFVAASVQNGVLDFDPRLGEFAARLPGALASIVLTAIVYVLAQRLYRKPHTGGLGGDFRGLLALQRRLRRDRLHRSADADVRGALAAAGGTRQMVLERLGDGAGLRQQTAGALSAAAGVAARLGSGSASHCGAWWPISRRSSRAWRF